MRAFLLLPFLVSGAWAAPGVPYLSTTLNDNPAVDSQLSQIETALRKAVVYSGQPAYGSVLCLNSGLTIGICGYSVSSGTSSGGGGATTIVTNPLQFSGNGSAVAPLNLLGNVTLQGNSFNGPNLLLLADAFGRYPGLNGSLIINLNASALVSGLVPDARLDSSSVTLQGPIVSSVAVGSVFLSAAGSNAVFGGTVSVTASQFTGTGSGTSPLALAAADVVGGTITSNASQFSGTGSGSSPLALISSSVTLQGNAFNTACGTVWNPSNGIIASTNTICLSGGYVGVGTTSPGQMLDLETSGSNDIAMRIGNAGNQFDFKRTYATGTLSIQGNQSGFNTIAMNPSGGNVSVGNASPAALFEVGSGLFSATSGGVGVGLESPSKNFEVSSNGSDTTLRLGNGVNSESFTFDFTRVYLTGVLTIQGNQSGYQNIALAPSAGNVGVGTAAPGSLFQVASGLTVDGSGDLTKINGVSYVWPGSQGSASYFLQNDGSGNLSWAPPSAGAAILTATQTFSGLDTFTNLMTLGSSLTVAGSIGINTTSPAQMLEVSGPSGAAQDTAIRLGAGATNASFTFDITRVYSTGVLQIQGNQSGYQNIALAPSAGNVGVGTTSPQNPLSVVGHEGNSGGTAPSVSACGAGSPSVAGTDVDGVITLGTAATACTLTFGKAWVNSAGSAAAPVCTIALNVTGITGGITSISSTAMTISLSISAGGDLVYYICKGAN